jgi:hypothetical protein
MASHQTDEYQWDGQKCDYGHVGRAIELHITINPMGVLIQSVRRLNYGCDKDGNSEYY